MASIEADAEIGALPRPSYERVGASAAAHARRLLLSVRNDPDPAGALAQAADLLELLELGGEARRVRAASHVHAGVNGRDPGERDGACAAGVAIEDLQRLMAAAYGAHPRSEPPRAMAIAGPADLMARLVATRMGRTPAAGRAGRDPAGADAPEPVEVSELPEGLLACLQAEPTPAVLARLQTILTVMASLPEPTTPREQHLTAAAFDDLATLADAAALRSLRALVTTCGALAQAPTGSAALFHAAARLRTAGLGPWARSMMSQLADAPELLVLIRQAWAEAPDLPPLREVQAHFALLLSGWLATTDLALLAGALGDLGLLDCVRAILARETMRPPRNGGEAVFWAARDAALDLGEAGLGLVAQQWLVLNWPHDPRELLVLADLEAAVGDPARATRLLELVELDPGAAPLLARRRLRLATGAAVAEPTAGFGTRPAQRRRREAWRRANTAETTPARSAGAGA